MHVQVISMHQHRTLLLIRHHMNQQVVQLFTHHMVQQVVLLLILHHTDQHVLLLLTLYHIVQYIVLVLILHGVLLQIDDTLYINWSDWQGTSKSEGEGIKDVGAAVSLICSSTETSADILNQNDDFIKEWHQRRQNQIMFVLCLK